MKIVSVLFAFCGMMTLFYGVLSVINMPTRLQSQDYLLLLALFAILTNIFKGFATEKSVDSGQDNKA